MYFVYKIYSVTVLMLSPEVELLFPTNSLRNGSYDESGLCHNAQEGSLVSHVLLQTIHHIAGVHQVTQHV